VKRRYPDPVTGDVLGAWTVVAVLGRDSTSNLRVEAKCVCGARKSAYVFNLRAAARKWGDACRHARGAGGRCRLCSGMGILPNFMDAPGGPRCACGRPSVRETGACGLARAHGAVPCPRCGAPRAA
jgi:hypothetical protein